MSEFEKEKSKPPFKKEISKSEANYGIVELKCNNQSSYNLPKDFFDYAKENNILIEDSDLYYPRKDNDGDAYVLSDDYQFKLGSVLLRLIGDKFEEYNNKFIASMSHSNNKLQIYRKVYAIMSKDDSGYEWFVKLYDNNIAGNILTLDMDKKNKIFTLDVKFNLTNSVSLETSKDNNKYAHNKIFFGAPGTGKSFQLNCDKKGLLTNNKDDENIENYYERVTFHPDYSYANFVGTYKPTVEEINNEDEDDENQITYEYVPGPFLRTLVKALINSSKIYLLIIEEINRANVYSVFGDIFQLLDRNKDNASMYPIDTSEDMKKYLKEKTGRDYDKISIPKNMYIWATMNSADQGVFPIDTAFKRRWDFTYISINNNEEAIEDFELKVAKYIYKWNDIRKSINNFLLENNINEDKLMGPFFVQEDSLKDFKESFKYKVLMYLYEDAARSIRPKLFSGSKGGSFSEICDEFDKNGIGIFNEDIINNIKDYSKENEYEED